jgi:hypothetical protein
MCKRAICWLGPLSEGCQQHGGAAGLSQADLGGDRARQRFRCCVGGSRRGVYHGYPIRRCDPFNAEVRRQWEKRNA